MLGLTNYVVIAVVNALNDSDKKPTNWFDRVPTIRLAALRSIYSDTRGNSHARSDIQKQAFMYDDKIKSVRQAYGLTGTSFSTHTPYRNGRQISLDDLVRQGDEVILVKTDLNLAQALKAAKSHRIMPERKGS